MVTGLGGYACAVEKLAIFAVRVFIILATHNVGPIVEESIVEFPLALGPLENQVAVGAGAD